jgi:hypothetical protein
MSDTMIEEFPIPEQSAPDRDSISLVPKQLHAWIENLPTGHPGQGAKEIYSALYQTNRQQIPAINRLRFLEEVTIPLSAIFMELQGKLSAATVAMNQEQERTSKIISRLHKEMALGYRCILEKPIRRGLLHLVNHQIEAKVVLRALQHLSEAALASYEIHKQPSGSIWRRIYALYNYAKDRKITRKKISIAGHREAEDIETIFKGILLLALSSPAAMRIREIFKVYSRLSEWAALTKLEPVKCQSPEQPLLAVNLVHDHPPTMMRSGSCATCNLADNCYALNTDTLLQYLETGQTQQETGADSNHFDAGPLEKNMLEALKRAWNSSRKRSSERQAIRIGVNVHLGLQSAHAQLELELEQKQEYKAAEQKPEPAELGTTLPPNAHRALPYPANIEISLCEEETIEVDAQTGHDWASHKEQSEIRHLSCETINYSSDGYCLIPHGKTMIPIHVGEPAIVREQPHGHWKPVIVSWIKRDEEKMLFGIRILAQSIESANLQPDDGMEECCLLLSNEPKFISPQRILTEPLLHRPGDKVSITHRGREIQLQLGECLSYTSGYMEFFCHPPRAGKQKKGEKPVLGKTARKAQANQKREELLDDFESLWKDL